MRAICMLKTRTVDVRPAVCQNDGASSDPRSTILTFANDLHRMYLCKELDEVANVNKYSYTVDRLWRIFQNYIHNFYH